MYLLQATFLKSVENLTFRFKKFFFGINEILGIDKLFNRKQKKTIFKNVLDYETKPA